MLKFLSLLFFLCVCVFACQGVPMEAREQLVRILSFCHACPWESNSGHPAWQEGTLSANPVCWPVIVIVYLGDSVSWTSHWLWIPSPPVSNFLSARITYVHHLYSAKERSYGFVCALPTEWPPLAWAWYIWKKLLMIDSLLCIHLLWVSKILATSLENYPHVYGFKVWQFE